MARKTKKETDGGIVNFLFEAGVLAKTPRSGFHFLGTGKQSVAEHVSRTTLIGYTLAMLSPKKVDELKVIKMCLLHDLAEGRTSDLNYVHQMYVKTAHEKAIEDLAKTLPFGKDLAFVVNEYEARRSVESLLAKDADNLEWILSLKEQVDVGNDRAKAWLVSAVRRLKTETAKKLAKEIVKTDSNRWWFGNKHDDWWVHRDKKKSKIHWNKE